MEINFIAPPPILKPPSNANPVQPQPENTNLLRRRRRSLDYQSFQYCQKPSNKQDADKLWEQTTQCTGPGKLKLLKFQLKPYFS